MKVYSHLPRDLPKGALAIGMFDGLHLGHQAILKRARECAPHVTILTFVNHPSSLLAPHRPLPPLLTPLPLKLALLAQSKLIDAVIALPFTQEVASMPYDLLLDLLHPSHLIQGEGDAFGNRRQGTPENVARYAMAKLLVAEYLPKISLDGAFISSSRIRTLIAAGDLQGAARLLGRPHCLFLPLPQDPVALPPDGTYSVRSGSATATLTLRGGRIESLSPPLQEPLFLSFDLHYKDLPHV